MAEGTLTTQEAQSTIKSLMFELTNLTPSSLITLFEIDLKDVLASKSESTLVPDAKKVQGNDMIGLDPSNPTALRFHNNIKVFNSTIMWQGKKYYPAPIEASGFETSSRGTLPTPSLAISSQSEKGTDQLALLRYQILKFGDIIGAKVTRRRTFAKYLDRSNFQFESQTTATQNKAFSPQIQELPQGYEPDPNAELPLDIYYIERKTAENKVSISYQLSSLLDLEGVKIPKRTVISDRCNWNYRGPGCWYQHLTKTEEANNSAPILQKADLTKNEIALPARARPAATDKDEKISSLLGNSFLFGSASDQGPWNKTTSYKRGDYVYIEKDKIKYYYVAKGGTLAQADSPSKNDLLDPAPIDTPPPNTSYWIADQCSKSLNGCRLRWGTGPSDGAVTPGGCLIGKGNGLPFGGFPAARKVAGGGLVSE